MALFSSRKRPAVEPVPLEPVQLEPAQAAPVAVEPAPLLADRPRPANGLRIAGAEPAPLPPAPFAEPQDEQSGDANAEDMRNLPLGTLLYRHGLVGEQELEEALTSGMASGLRLGEILISRGLVSADDVARLLAVQQGLPFLQADEIAFDAEAAALLPADDARSLGAVPVSFADGSILVVTPEPSPQQREELEHRLHLPISTAVVAAGAFDAFLAQASAPAEAPEEEVAAPVADEAPVSGHEAASVEEWAGEAAVEAEPVESSWEEPAAEEPSFSGSGYFEPVESELSEPEQLSDPEPAPEQAVEAEAGAFEPAAELEPAGFAPADSEPEPVEERWAEPEPVEEPEAFEAQWAEPESVEEPEPVEAQWAEPEPVEDSEPVEALWAEPEPVEEHEAEAVESAPAVLEDGRIDELGARHEASVGRIHDLLGQIEAGASTFTDLRRRLSELGESLRTTEETLAEREQRLAELGQLHEDDQRRIDELVGQLRERDEALGELGGRVEELSGRLVSAEERLDERERRLAELDASLSEGAARVEELFRQVELRDQALAGFADSLDELAHRFGDPDPS